MHPLEKDILQVITQQTSLTSGDTLIVGVSGGPDSLALLNILSLEKEVPLDMAAIYANGSLVVLTPHEPALAGSLLDSLRASRDWSAS